jgi:hypothetical protein
MKKLLPIVELKIVFTSLQDVAPGPYPVPGESSREDDVPFLKIHSDRLLSSHVRLGPHGVHLSDQIWHIFVMSGIYAARPGCLNPLSLMIIQKYWAKNSVGVLLIIWNPNEMSQGTTNQKPDVGTVMTIYPTLLTVWKTAHRMLSHTRGTVVLKLITAYPSSY